jgi:hypothetical protein
MALKRILPPFWADLEALPVLRERQRLAKPGSGQVRSGSLTGQAWLIRSGESVQGYGMGRAPAAALQVNRPAAEGIRYPRALAWPTVRPWEPAEKDSPTKRQGLMTP